MISRSELVDGLKMVGCVFRDMLGWVVLIMGLIGIGVFIGNMVIVGADVFGLPLNPIP